MNKTHENGTLLEVENLEIAFKTDEGIIQAIDGVSFRVERGKTLGIVGESGSGKSISTQTIMRLLPDNAIIGDKTSIRLHPASGNVVDIARLDRRGEQIRKLRGGEIAMIFQEPMRSFSPVYTIGNQMSEAIQIHRNVDKREARKIGIDMLDRVGISNPARRFDQYPFELSGGMRQRAMIATALSTQPSLLIADEPTTALDVTIQAQILELMRELQQDFNMAIIFISHDLGVISQIAHDVAVMYLGRIMETGTVRDVVKTPKHPYTRSLLNAIPKIENLDKRLEPVSGDIPSLLARPSGCPFYPRCREYIQGSCEQKANKLTTITASHSVNCVLYEEGAVIDDTARA